MQRGLFSRVRGDVYCLAPPIVTKDTTIDQIIDIIADSTKAVLG
jgi:adenosylmethionine-8-amino-7-oxononanoate aminotransferase